MNPHSFDRLRTGSPLSRGERGYAPSPATRHSSAEPVPYSDTGLESRRYHPSCQSLAIVGATLVVALFPNSATPKGAHEGRPYTRHSSAEPVPYSDTGLESRGVIRPAGPWRS